MVATLGNCECCSKVKKLYRNRKTNGMLCKTCGCPKMECTVCRKVRAVATGLKDGKPKCKRCTEGY